MFQSKPSHFLTETAEALAPLAEVLGAFSHILDLAEGQPLRHSIRCCWMGAKLAEAARLHEAARWHAYYAVLLKDLGCSSNSAQVAKTYVADDRRIKPARRLSGRGIFSALRFVIVHAGQGLPAGKRAKVIARALKRGPRMPKKLVAAKSAHGADIARALRLPEGVAQAIAALDEHWNGGGRPKGLIGNAIPIGARIALIVQTADVFHGAGGPELARKELRKRRGTMLDPKLTDTFLALSAEKGFWEEANSPDIERRMAAMEPPGPFVLVDEDYLDGIAAAFGRVIDAKSSYTEGHSARVGELCDEIAAELGYAPEHRRALRRAAMLHDVGKLGVSSTIIEKPGKLDGDEWRTMQAHAARTTEILGRIAALSEMALIAGSHHERLDGRGYPLGVGAGLITLDTRIITASDFFDALTSDRPYRPALGPSQAIGVMADQVGTAIDPQCFAALNAVIAKRATAC